LAKLSTRKIGPAIIIEIIRYYNLRKNGEAAIAEAVVSSLLPQLVGLDEDKLRKTWLEIKGVFSDESVPNRIIKPVLTELVGFDPDQG
jgi:hypothetical protein